MCIIFSRAGNFQTFRERIKCKLVYFRIFFRHVIQLSEPSVCWFGNKGAEIPLYGSEWQARTSAELSARRGANGPRVRQGWVTASPLYYPSLQPGLVSDRAPRRSGGPATTDPHRAHANCTGCKAWCSVAGTSLDGRIECYRRFQVSGVMGH